MTEPQFTTEELNSEEWKLIPEFEMYEVSSLGRVRRAIACQSSEKGRIIKARHASSGYPGISLVKGKTYSRSVHKLVALAFLGEPPSKGHQVNHKDGNKGNARLSNLEYCTAKENSLHAIKVLGRRRDGAHSGCARFTEGEILAIHEALMAGTSPVEIMERFGISETQLYRIKKREVWHETLKDLPSDYPKPRRRQPAYNLTASDVQAIKRRIAQGETNKQIAKDYAVKSDGTIQFIRLGKSWKSITP